MRKKIIAANWKMNMSASQAEFLLAALVPKISNTSAECLILPPFTSLYAVKKLLAGTGIALGAQNMHYMDNGPFTGEISPLMLKEAGVEYVLLGHSERRALGESGEMINLKVKSAVNHGIKPIICLGEPQEVRESGTELEFISNQLDEELGGICLCSEMLIAYEPIWATGTGCPADSADAQRCASFIRSYLAMKDSQCAQEIRILYGGSINSSNIASFLSQSDIDGALVGGASLNESFERIARYDEEF
ncbi:MAG: triose-phosphate isomerase [Eubacteriaceae bacterium]|nr:triose-phosphate isomerase [Eubacteriaceae bacterium]